MAAPGTSLAPDELDRLEDALERWTDGVFEPGPEDSLLAAPLRERLDAYREVLAQVREALPLEDVGDDVLAEVLAEARRGEAKPRRDAASGPGWWERLRRSMLLPGVALAGSAALLLYLVQPSEELTLTSAAQDEAAVDREAARLAPEAGPAPAAPSPADPGEMMAPEFEDRRSAGGMAAEEAPAVAPPAAADAKEIKADRPRAKAMAKDDAPAEAPLPGLDGATPAAADKEDLRDTLERADKARRGHDCDAAKADYVDAMGMDGHPTERAQARAGYGLCLQQVGEDATAAKYLEEARKLWPGIDGWIDRESGEGKKPSKAKAPAPKPKPMVDAFEGK